MSSGEFASVRYEVSGPVLFHSRLLVWPGPEDADSWYVCTPEGDTYTEVLVEGVGDVHTVHFLGRYRAYPEGVRAANVNESDQLLDDASLRRLILEACEAYGIPATTEMLSATISGPRQPTAKANAARGSRDAVQGGVASLAASLAPHASRVAPTRSPDTA